MEYKNAILKTMLITFASLIGALILVFLLMNFVFTATFANLMYDIGCDKFASNLYERAYKKDGDILLCYKAFNLKVKLGNSKETIELYDLLVQDEEYEDFVAQCNARNEKLDISVLEKSTMLNEENYLFNCYVKALKKENNNDKAFEYSIEKFLDTCDTVELKEFGIYSLGNFVDVDVAGFDKEYSNSSKTLLEEMQEYFEEMQLIFDENKVTDNVVVKAYVVAIGNRIIELGQDINAVYRALEMEESLIEYNINVMKSINDSIKGLIV
ncbi:MAG: hypothetical protein IJW59_02310 [Clostridia bacterium]|nr:hypothetical protein [Clostridia bacterium]